ncbi:MAG: ParH-like protein [Actinobacteria bacterium]|nr:MAG: ParH-like protein [Actinomycetota bacterium]
MLSAQVRKTCQDRLDSLRRRGLEVPSPFDANALCQSVARCLGHPIMLVAVPMPPCAPSGLTLFTDESNVIVYELHTSRMHQDHIIAHELGHVILGHQALALDDAEKLRLLVPSLRPGLVRQVLGRSGTYSAIEEQQAEMMATLLLEEASRGTPRSLTVAESSDDELRERLRSSLERPHR